MKKIVSIKIKEQEVVLDEYTSSYISNSLNLLFLNENISIKKNTIVLQDDLIFKLRNTILNCLTTLVENLHIEPSIKEIQKNPTRFEKIVLNKKVYKVNYRMSEVDRSCYVLYCLLLSLENANNNHEYVLINLD
ncbi:hypothetical protein [Chryseobacterium sp. GP-SGM7]|uniref:hypothetical protein n=1 Tax=Chryseobacterium sp. GP-SGM7 TaxID=3411323 RepID=UPI003B931099